MATDPPGKVTVTLRLSPSIHALLREFAEADGATLNRWITESLLLRCGYILGVQAGSVSRDLTVAQDRAMHDAVRDVFAELLTRR